MSKELAKTSDKPNLPAVPDFVQPVEGGGLENARMQDFQVARLMLMQALSPLVVDGDAVAGELRESVENQLIAGLVGKGKEATGETIEFIPCYHFLEWIHWAPRDSGKGMLARDIDPKGELAQSVARGEMVRVGEREVFKVTEYHNFLCLLPSYSMEKPIVLSCSKTQIKKARQLLTMIRYRGPTVPMFATKFTLTSVKETKNDNTYWNYEFENDGWASEEQYKIGEGLFNMASQAYKERRIVVDAPTDSGDTDGGGGDERDF